MVSNFKKAKNSGFFYGFTRTQVMLVGVIFLISIFTALCYLGAAQHRYEDIYSGEAINLAKSLGALLPRSEILNLTFRPGMADDNPVKNMLAGVLENTSFLHHSFLLAKSNGRISVLTDSCLNGEINLTTELQEEILNSNERPILSKSGCLTESGESGLTTVLVPLLSVGVENTTFFVGLSFNTLQWKAKIRTKMIPETIISFGLAFIFPGLYLIWIKGTALAEKRRESALTAWHTLFQEIPVGIVRSEYCADSGECLLKNLNWQARTILGFWAGDKENPSWSKFLDPKDFQKKQKLLERALKEERSYCIELQITRPDGAGLWVRMKIISPVEHKTNKVGYFTLMERVPSVEPGEKTGLESGVSPCPLSSMVYRRSYDHPWTLDFVSRGALELTGYHPKELIHDAVVSYKDLLSGHEHNRIWKKWRLALDLGHIFQSEYDLVAKNGKRKRVLELGWGVYREDGSVLALEGIVLDISKREDLKAEIKHLRCRDPLTGLYNRKALEQKMAGFNRLEGQPLGIVVFDINGLEAFNDVYGCAQGDCLIRKTANFIQGSCREEDILARSGGSEFVLLMPRAGAREAEKLIQSVEKAIKHYNQRRKGGAGRLSLTMGYSVVETDTKAITEGLREARLYLKTRKILQKESLQHSVLSSLLAVLYAKSEETEEHGRRVGDYAVAIGRRLGLKERFLDDLRLLALLHDIGKVAVSERVLNKPGKLTADEWEEIKKHPEIGQRIVASIQPLEHIAKYILYHHERWDGTGYPCGLAGKKIPLLTRILSIADAYDAMTEERVYSKALPRKAARRELKEGAGTQFDPELVQVFLKILETE